MTHRRIIFSSPNELLIDSTRLTALKSKVDSIASDLATLDGKTEAQRRADKSTRDSVLNAFEKLGEV